MSVNTVESSDNNEVVIKVSGRFDFSCHQSLLKATKPTLPDQNVMWWIWQAEFMDSSAMGMLLQLREYGDIREPESLVNGSDSVKDILRIANFDKLFTIG